MVLAPCLLPRCLLAHVKHANPANTGTALQTMCLHASGTHIVLLTLLGPLCTWRWACALCFGNWDLKLLPFFWRLISSFKFPATSHCCCSTNLCVHAGYLFLQLKPDICLWKHFEPLGKVSVLTCNITGKWTLGTFQSNLAALWTGESCSR